MNYTYILATHEKDIRTVSLLNMKVSARTASDYMKSGRSEVNSIAQADTQCFRIGVPLETIDDEIGKRKNSVGEFSWCVNDCIDPGIMCRIFEDVSWRKPQSLKILFNESGLPYWEPIVWFNGQFYTATKLMAIRTAVYQAINPNDGSNGGDGGVN